MCMVEETHYASFNLVIASIIAKKLRLWNRKTNNRNFIIIVG